MAIRQRLLSLRDLRQRRGLPLLVCIEILLAAKMMTTAVTGPAFATHRDDKDGETAVYWEKRGCRGV